MTRAHPPSVHKGATCTPVGTLHGPPWRHTEDMRLLDRAGGGLAVRADLLGDIHPAVLRDHMSGELIYSLRTTGSGGVYAGSTEQRERRLLAAAKRYDLVELEIGRDTTPAILAAIPPHHRLLAWYGPSTTSTSLTALLARFSQMAGIPARHYSLTTHAATAEQALAPLRLLHKLNRTNVTAFSVGETGPCGRLLAPWLGAPMVYGRIGGRTDEVPSINRLLRDYPFPAVPQVRHLFGLAGRSVAGSFSPRLHNRAYRALGYPGLYLPIPTTDFLSTWRTFADGLAALGFPLVGGTIEAPYKEAALRLAEVASGAAARAGAANVLVRTESGWRAHTTDPIGVVGALGRAGIQLTGRKAAVVGCGGAGRGAAAGLLRFGVTPTLVNRGQDRGGRAARLLGLDYVPLHRFTPEDYSLIVHATPVREDLVFSLGQLPRDTILVDLAYGRRPTALVDAARRLRLRVIDGWEVLRIVAARQFRLMTGRSMPNFPAPEHLR
ncbi:type I 3-dehydroquinate dehydratase [Kibdelosporangium persicum]|uniref:Shikimate dehydrogenase / 3-dehydroquinate dehydratase n=1 Tax=Kibdelosporangium persicum TaxID=2698649 RepID=A0ABX2EWE5_9PSEU|nr:type I 3-dehydroquinate dehydratase [Kibdelosporangium persicum]NRN63303.1 Shikimate dehydrogenase / 3-dehydroquinate dehydratase [Kibdelosporangium persicum]